MHTTRVPPRATVEPSAPVTTHSERKQHSLLRSVLLHLAPTVEELYFRGYLMPALGRYGAWASVAGVTLFTLYHFESPWEGPVRFAVVLPMAWAVWKLRSVRLGIVVHATLNTLSAVALTLAVLSAR